MVAEVLKELKVNSVPEFNQLCPDPLQKVKEVNSVPEFNQLCPDPLQEVKEVVTFLLDQLDQS